MHELGEEQVSGAAVLRIQLGDFEGPLDLLLHLIKKHELDILDIPIAFVTDEYLRYIDAMARLDLAIAGEYLVMAATLLQMKSAMLLPKPELDEDGDEEEGDPRAELIARLLAYQKFKDAARGLDDRPVLFREEFPRPESPPIERPPATVDDLVPIDLFELLDVFRTLVKSKRAPRVHEVTRRELSLKDTINRIAVVLETRPRTTMLELLYALDEEPDLHRIVVTFMGLLEMAKLRLVRLFQARISSDDLIVERAVIDISEIAGRLEIHDDAAEEPTTEEPADDKH